MATPKIIADFETQLATAIAVSDTSFTLASATDDDGVALPAGLYYFTVNDGRSNKEYLAGTLSGTSVTSVLHVSAQGAETSGANKAHRIGDSVKITDFATYKKYMDEIATAGASDGDTSTKGVFEGATLAEVRAGTASGSTGANLAVTPDVLDDLPTEDEKGALAGASNTPDASNKFVTEDDLSDSAFKAPVVETFTSSGTWTKDSGLKYVVVEVQAAGGGGGGGSDSPGNQGGGGGGGGYSKKTILASALGSTETVTVGTGGAGGVSGSAGGSSSFGSHATTTGGSGGPQNGGTPAAGGVGSSGDINLYGDEGGEDNDAYGRGGASFLGAPTAGTPNGTGVTGKVYGGGGSGGERNEVGGAGAAGIVIVTEYYS